MGSIKSSGNSLPLPLKSTPINTTGEIIRALLSKQDFIIVDLQLSPEERNALRELNIEIEGLTGNFLYWGSINNEVLFSNLKLYLLTIGKNRPQIVEAIFSLILRTVKNVTTYFGTEFAWIEIKTFLANDTFVIPRWHTDNKFFTPYTAYKLVWAAKGAQTRFGTTKNLKEFEEYTILEIQAGHGTKDNIRARKRINQIVKEIDLPKKDGGAILYRSGGINPVIHSEPHMDKDRLFLAIVPGSKERISEWQTRKKEKDIRKKIKGRKWCYSTL